MEVEKEVSKVMADLHSGSRNSLYNSLIILRTTLIKSKAALNLLVQNDAVKLLVQLLEDHRRHVNRTKTIDIVMSILANMCIEEDIREKVSTFSFFSLNCKRCHMLYNCLLDTDLRLMLSMFP